MKNNHRGIKARILSFKYAMKGFAHLFRDEPNSIIHFLCALLAIVAGFYFDITRYDWLWILSAITLVLVTEILNTAIENLVDIVRPDYDLKAGKVKDLCAGAVLLASLYAVGVGVAVFLPHVTVIL